MTEVNAGFKQFFHCYIRHLISPFWFLPPLFSSRDFTFCESTIKPVGERANYKICFLYQIIFDKTIIIENMACKKYSPQRRKDRLPFYILLCAFAVKWVVKNQFLWIMTTRS
jgi:hypothetical protein